MSDERPQPDAAFSAQGLRIAVIVSRYNAEITEALLEGARSAFNELGGAEVDLTIVRVPGAFELPALAGVSAANPQIDAVVALGCLIRGETAHDRVIADAVAGALAGLSATAGVAIGFGLLTTDTLEQARARASGARDNKGDDAMRACIATHRAIEMMRTPTRFGFAESKAGRGQ